MELARDMKLYYSILSIRLSPLPAGEEIARGSLDRGRRRQFLVERRRRAVRRFVFVGNPRQLLPRLLSLALPVPHTGIKSARCQKPGVRPALSDAALIEDDDLVGTHDGGQPVRDHQRGAVARDSFQRILDFLLGVAVE